MWPQLEGHQANTAAAPTKRIKVDLRPATITGLVIVLSVFGGFGTWAALAPLAGAIIAQGTVKVDTDRKEVQHVEGGVVQELLVRDGDVVEAGDVIVRLDKTRSKASYDVLQVQHDTARAEAARLTAELNRIDQIDFPADLKVRANRDPQVAEIVSGQESLFNARRVSLSGQTSILRQKVAQLKEEITGLEAQLRAKRHQSSLIREELKGLQELFDKGFAKKPRLLALQRERARLQGEIAEHLSEIARAKTKIGETELEVFQLEREFHEEVVAALHETQARIADTEVRMADAAHVVEQMEIRAPVSGIVVGMDVGTVGGVIKAGETMLEIVPVNDGLLIEARVQPSDVDSLSVGLPAFVRFTAFKQRTTPTVNGEVVYLSADSLIDERTGEAYYVTRVEVSDEEVRRLGDRPLQPGMPAEVVVETVERTALHYLVQPLMDAMVRAWREE